MRPSQGGDPVLPRTSTFGGGAGGYCGSYDSLQRDVSTDYDGSDDYFNQVIFFFLPLRRPCHMLTSSGINTGYPRLQ